MLRLRGTGLSLPDFPSAAPKVPIMAPATPSVIEPSDEAETAEARLRKTLKALSCRRMLANGYDIVPWGSAHCGFHAGRGSSSYTISSHPRNPASRCQVVSMSTKIARMGSPVWMELAAAQWGEVAETGR